MSPEQKRKRRKIALIAAVPFVGLGAFYQFQPLRFDLFPKEPPPFRPIDGDEIGLFKRGVKVAVVVAHPDDSEFYVAGTLLQLRRAGARVDQLLHTNGDKAFYFWQDNTGLSEVRKREQTEASSAYGVRELVFMGEPGGRLAVSSDVIDKTVDQLRAWDPDVILCFDPEYPPRRSHQDHRNSGEITLEAVKRMGFQGWVLMFSTRGSNYGVEMDKDWPEKRRLVALHASQFSEKQQFIEDMISRRDLADGKRFGLKRAETFRAIRFGSQRKSTN